MSTEIKVNRFPLCDFIEGSIWSDCRDEGEARYDGKTIHGPWAYMCEQHFTEFGVGLGTGRGQRLILR